MPIIRWALPPIYQSLTNRHKLGKAENHGRGRTDFESFIFPARSSMDCRSDRPPIVRHFTPHSATASEFSGDCLTPLHLMSNVFA